ncbi:hypothetical protein [Candidatus Entotheonella palauensis]|uniref:hypothetical protein n=1 Tax=Candidatus Entotheonella palauensis TaxID=93172 RepID=UPI000B8004DA|nr:hypothetical protein [Candidatus Entotheonella palauensis]
MQVNRLRGLSVFMVGVFLACVGFAYGQMHPGVHPVPAVIVQVLKAFDNPEGAIFSADGKFVFVSNAAEIGADRADAFGWEEGAGYISKLEVRSSGALKMVNDKLITGLTGPLGMGVLPVSTGKFPAGSIFVCVGSAPFRDKNGQVVKDPKRLQTKLLVFNVDGQTLGEIKTGVGSAFEEVTGSPITLINALGFDKSGNVYIADTAFGGDQFDPPVPPKGGLWMIPVGALDALADNRAPTDQVKFIPVPGNPDGVEVSPTDGKIYVNTVGPVAGAPDPAGGGIYGVTMAEFDGGQLPSGALVDSQLGALDGLDFTAGGTMLNTQIKGDVPPRIYVNCPGKPATTLELQPSGTMAELTGPADVAVKKLDDGSHLVVIPELYARDTTPGDDEITVVILPPNFDAACQG